MQKIYQVAVAILGRAFWLIFALIVGAGLGLAAYAAAMGR